MRTKRTYFVVGTNCFALLFLYGILCGYTSHAQTKDTTLHNLTEVIVAQNKQEQLQSSKKTISIDSAIMARYNTTSLVELLSEQSTIHIKNYGNGNIATTSFRGGNAHHTALLWNGLNIQNPMLGQNDLSLVSALLFDDVKLEYGGGSALWGSSALGGSIQLQNKAVFNKGFQTKLQVSGGSFDTKKIASSIILSYKKIVSSTKMYYTVSENNYHYLDTTDKADPNKQVAHANYQTKGLMQEISFLIPQYQKINIRAWYNHTNRNLPSFTSPISKRSQEDQNLKLNADWNYEKGNLYNVVRFGFLHDKLNYTDSIANIYSKTKSNSIIAESDNIYTLNQHKINLGTNFTRYESIVLRELERTANFQARDTSIKHHLSKLALFAAYQISLFNDKLKYNLAVRKEFTNLTQIPFTGNTGISFQATAHITFKINASKAFRQPTLNDLYWYPGGNPNLKPESAYDIDGTAEYQIKKETISFLIQGSYFNRRTKNWIMWLPNANGYSSPINIAEVYSRGTETKTELTYHKKNFKIKLQINTSYVLSTTTKNNNENDNSLGRQLIYTPRYSGQGNLHVYYKGFSLLFNQTYTGYRFTANDNSSWLTPYYISNAKVAYKYSFAQLATELFLNINNIFNANYMVISNTPMALRNFEGGIILQFNQYKKPKSN